MIVRRANVWVLAVLLLVPGCATTPAEEDQREAIEADILDILSLSLGEDSEPVRCLSILQYSEIRPLDDKHLLFSGKGDRQWVNVLRHRCHDLLHNSALRIRSHSTSHVCSSDRFQVSGVSEVPSASQTPQPWGAKGSRMTCTIGRFYPVTNAQLGGILAAISDR